MKKVMYVVGSKEAPEGFNEEGFFMSYNKLYRMYTGASENICFETPEELKAMQLAAGMEEEFYDKSSQLFRITIEKYNPEKN